MLGLIRHRCNLISDVTAVTALIEPADAAAFNDSTRDARGKLHALISQPYEPRTFSTSLLLL